MGVSQSKTELSFVDFDFPRKSPDVTVSKCVYLKQPIINKGESTLFH